MPANRTGDEDDSDDEGEELAPTDGTGKRKRRSVQEVQMEQARQTLDNVEKQYAWQAHWESRQRSREFMQLIDRLHGHGRKVGAHFNDEAQTLSSRLFAVAEVLEFRYKMFERIRGPAVELAVKGMTGKEVEALNEGPCELLVSIMMGVCAKLVEGMGQTIECAEHFVKMLSYKFSRIEGIIDHDCTYPLSMGLLRRVPDTSIVHAQRQLALTFADKYCKLECMHMVAVANLIRTHVPTCDWSGPQPQQYGGFGRSELESGFAFQPWYDLRVMIKLGEILENSSVAGVRLNKAQQREAALIAQHADKISARLRSNFRSVMCPNAKSAWEKILKLNHEVGQHAAMCSAIKPEEIEKLVSDLEKAVSTGYSEAYNSIGAALNDRFDELAAFGGIYCEDEPAGADSVDERVNLKNMAGRLGNVLLKGADVVCQANDFFSDIITKVATLATTARPSDPAAEIPPSQGSNASETSADALSWVLALLGLLVHFKSPYDSLIQESLVRAQLLSDALEETSKKKTNDDENIAAVEVWAGLWARSREMKVVRK